VFKASNCKNTEDMKQKSKVSKILGLLFFTVIGGFVGFGIGKIMNPNHLSHQISKDVLIISLIWVIPAFFLAIAWHEGGHAIAGLKMDFDFRMYIVGPFMWEKEGSNWRFKWNKNFNTAGGMVLCLPRDSVNLPYRFSVFAAGGPIASLVLTGLCYWVFWAFFKTNPTNSQSMELVGNCFAITALLSFFFFVITIIPLHTGGFYTDGARILRLQKGGEVAQFDTLLLKTIANSSSGIRPKLLEIKDIEQALMLSQRINEPFGVYLHSYLYQAAFDMGDMEKAENHLQDYINEVEKIPEGFRSMVWVEAAFFYAFAKNDLSKSEDFWQKFKPSPMIPKAQILATEASLSFLKNDNETALSKIMAAEKEIPLMIDKGIGVALHEKLAFLKSKIQK
jgi:hypothetical protein